MNRVLFLVSICFFLFSNITNAQRLRTDIEDLTKLYTEVDSEAKDFIKVQNTPPVIGISSSNYKGSSRITETYIDAVIKAGGTPIVIPVTTDSRTLRDIISRVDGLILSGGADINPLYYKEDSITTTLEVDRLRDKYELILLKLATDRNVPTLGICRGEQLINIAFGGTLYQDIPSQYANKTLKHSQSEPREQGTHTVSITKGTQLANILGNQTDFSVNTFHHQAVKDVAPGFKVIATASDGLIEGIEAYPNRPILAVQWHPEALAFGGDESMLKIFKFMVEKADTYRKAKELHKKILSVDTHCDTPLLFTRNGINFIDRDTMALVSLPKMEEGKLDGIFMAAYMAQGPRDKQASQKAVEHITGLIKAIHHQIELNPDLCGLARTSQDLKDLKRVNKKAVFIGIENGYGIGKNIDNLTMYKQMGVNYMTLCHTVNNDICDTSTKTSKKEWNGLSPFGKDVIKEMNRIGMIVDVSHAGEDTFWDVIKLSNQPIVATHSSCRALVDHDRNLTDDQLRALAKNGGVVQICLVDLFLNKDPKKASLTDALNHIDHAVKIAGIDHVGIGSDFDGGGGLIGCNGANDLINITVGLMERGYSDDDIAKIWGGNFLRVLDTVQSVTTYNLTLPKER